MNRFVYKEQASIVHDAGVVGYKWWQDTHGNDFKLYLLPADRDPNLFVKKDSLWLFFESWNRPYCICNDCYLKYKIKQFCGAEKGPPGWLQEAVDKYQYHQAGNGWCEFCDPQLGKYTMDVL